jgi:hypothetical protein
MRGERPVIALGAGARPEGHCAGTSSGGVGSWVVSAASPTVGDRTWSVGVGTWSVCRIFDNEGQVNIRASSHRGGSHTSAGTWSLGVGSWRTSERLRIAADHTICGSSAGTWSVGVGSRLGCATSSIVGARTWAVGAGTWSLCRIFDDEGQDGVNGRRN